MMAVDVGKAGISFIAAIGVWPTEVSSHLVQTHVDSAGSERDEVMACMF